MQNRQIIRVKKHTDNCQKLEEGGWGSACLVGSGFLCEEMKCSDLDSHDSSTALHTDDESLSCTFYTVNFICELDSNLKIVIDRGFFFFFLRIHTRNTSYPEFCLVLTLLTSVGKHLDRDEDSGFLLQGLTSLSFPSSPNNEDPQPPQELLSMFLPPSLLLLPLL